VFYNSEWGSVCNVRQVDADVACHQLGYNRSAAVPTHTYEGESSRRWLNGLTCTGTEKSIAKCSNNGWLTSHCACATVICAVTELCKYISFFKVLHTSNENNCILM